MPRFEQPYTAPALTASTAASASTEALLAVIRYGSRAEYRIAAHELDLRDAARVEAARRKAEPAPTVEAPVGPWDPWTFAGLEEPTA